MIMYTLSHVILYNFTLSHMIMYTLSHVILYNFTLSHVILYTLAHVTFLLTHSVQVLARYFL